MCLIFLSLNHHSTYKIIVAANRDEFYDRKTAPAEYWTEHPQVIGGRDLEANGTWMAMNTNGRLAMVTNYRDLTSLKIKAPSRGELVSNYLLSNKTPLDYLNQVLLTASLYNGFNLLVGNVNELYYLSNYKDGIERVPDGLHGLSNALLNTPWPKVERGKKKFAEVVSASIPNTNDLFDLLADDSLAPDDQLPNTGVGLKRERMLSAMFIRSPHYGTRCSTVVLVNKSNEVTYIERVYDLRTYEPTTRQFLFSVNTR